MPVKRDRFEQGTRRYSIEGEIVDLLYDNQERAYNIHEITIEVMQPGWSESKIDSRSFEKYIGCILDLATVSSILDQLVDDGQIERRILDTGDGKRSYYAAR
ncbi:hypothetical protein ACNS7O_15195 (plasmid) [Haloferacaceae archaeon DSL9]